MGLEGRMLHGLRLEYILTDIVGISKTLFYITKVPLKPDIYVPFSIIMDLRRPFCHRLFRIKDRWELLIINLDKINGLIGQVFIYRGYRYHPISYKPYLISCQGIPIGKYRTWRCKHAIFISC